MHLISRLTASIAASLSMCASAQTAIDESMENLKASGYTEVLTLSFFETKLPFAVTGLHKGKQAPELYWATISLDADGVSMMFSTNRLCVPNTTVRPLPRRIVSVNGQKIEAVYVCHREPSGVDTLETFVLKSSAGNEFAKKAFAGSEDVVVLVNDLLVPFKTRGFSEALTKAGGSVL